MHYHGESSESVYTKIKLISTYRQISYVNAEIWVALALVYYSIL